MTEDLVQDTWNPEDEIDTSQEMGMTATAGEFVVNVPSIDLEEEMHFCGTKSGRDHDKFTELDLTPIPAEKVKSPLIKECFGHLECKVVHSHTYGDHTLIVGEVISATVNDEVLIDGRLDLMKAKPIINKNRIYRTVTDQE